MQTIAPILLFVLGLGLLIKGGDIFVDSAISVARRFHLPEVLIGATIVSIGTTLPEVMVSATSAISGNTDMSFGNAIGSVICNTALIAGFTQAIRPSKVGRKDILFSTICFFAAAAFYCVVAIQYGIFNQLSGFILVGMFIVYITISAFQMKDDCAPPAAIEAQKEPSHLVKDILLLVLGGGLIFVGSRLLVDNGVILAKMLNVPDKIIALTFVALGTSLPELVTAVTALIKGHTNLSLGNIIGANLFNIVLVSGVAAILCPIPVPMGALSVDLPLMLGVMALLTVPTLIFGKVQRWQGVLLLGLYVGYCIFLF